MLRFLILMLAALILAGCSMVPYTPEYHAQQEQQRFIEALDQFVASHQTILLQQIQKDSPDSPWGRRAKTLLHYFHESESRKERLAALRDELKDLKQDIAESQQQNQQLSKKIEQLTKLLFDLEQQPQ